MEQVRGELDFRPEQDGAAEVGNHLEASNWLEIEIRQEFPLNIFLSVSLVLLSHAVYYKQYCITAPNIKRIISYNCKNPPM